MSVWFVLMFAVCATCGSVNKIVYVSLYYMPVWFVNIMRVCTEMECGQCVHL